MIESNNKLLAIVITIVMIPATLAIIILESGLLLAIIVMSCVFVSLPIYHVFDKKCPFNAGHDFQLKRGQDLYKPYFICCCVKCGKERVEYLPK